MATVPTVWTVLSLINYRYPGDEYGGWGIGSFPGLWILPVVQGTFFPILPSVVLSGCLVMFVLGAIADKVSMPWLPWYGIWLLASGAFFAYSLSQFPSLERAISKNGSIEAYVLPSLNLGLVFSTVALALATFCYRVVDLAVWRWQGRHVRPNSPASLTAESQQK